MDEHVSETAHSFQSIEKRCGDHVVPRELDQDVLIVLSARPEMRAQNVIADVEDDLGAELQTAFDRPRIAESQSLYREAGASEFFETGDDLFQTKQTFANGLRPKDQRGVPRAARQRASTGRRDTA